MSPDRPDDGERHVADSHETIDLGVLVIGAGAAGARTAIELVESGVDPEDVLVVGKRSHGDAHTTWARGGINGALGTHDPEDDWTVHAADTLEEGHFLNDPAKVETVTRRMPGLLRELDEWGMTFSRTDDGEIDQRYFGAQSFRRTAFAGDHTGESLLKTLIGRARKLSVPCRENVFVTRLVTENGRVHGAAGYDTDTGEFVVFDADTVVLAAGGYTGLFDRHSSRDDENTGDGPALAYRAGARLMDVEFVQFHPTGMVGDRYGDEWDGRLVTEAVRGEGGRLFNAEVSASNGSGDSREPGSPGGERFMDRYSPDQMGWTPATSSPGRSPGRFGRVAAPRTAAYTSTSPTATGRSSGSGSPGCTSGSTNWASTWPRRQSRSHRPPTTGWAASSSMTTARRTSTACTPSARPWPASTGRTVSAGTRWRKPSPSAG